MEVRKTRNDAEVDSGVALILVMLAILVLTTLAAAMVFSARSETLASYNYRIATQAEYASQAGVQRALNFFTSSRYVGLPPTSASTYYDVSTYANNPTDVFYSDGTPVQCLSGCTGGAGNVMLRGSSGNYPPSLATGSIDVVGNWNTDMTNITISDGSGGSGTFTVVATLLDYHTVNDAFFGVAATGCSDSQAGLGVCRKGFEVWRVVSRGTWNSNIGGTVGGVAVSPTVEMEATIAPMYLPYFGNALYGLCSTYLGGNVCTDSYNSAVGNYGGSIDSCATTSGGGAANRSASNAGIGSNGGVTISGGSYNIGGNVTYANAASPDSCNTGFQGSDQGVAGDVLPGPAVPTPTPPDMSAWGYTGTPPYNSTAPAAAPPGSGGGIDHRVTNIYLKPTTVPIAPGATPCTTCDSTGFVSGQTGYMLKYTVGEGSGAYPHTYTYANCSCQQLTGTGAYDSPYRLGAVDASGSGRYINFIAPANGIGNPAYLAANSVTTGTSGMVNLSASAPTTPLTKVNAADPGFNPNPPANTNSAVVLDVGNNVALGGTSSLNYNSAAPGTPAPDYLRINIMGTDAGPSVWALDLTGQSKLSAIVSVPNGGAQLTGSGAGGSFFGAIIAKDVRNNGNYAVHYDLASKVQSGKLFSTQVVSITRPKM